MSVFKFSIFLMNPYKTIENKHVLYSEPFYFVGEGKVIKNE